MGFFLCLFSCLFTSSGCEGAIVLWWGGSGVERLRNPFYYDVLMGMALFCRAIGLRVTDQLLLVLA